MIPRFCPELTLTKMHKITQEQYNPGDLEKQCCELLGVKGVLPLSSGREALFHALNLAGVKAGDEVIMPSLNCTAVAEAVIATGARVVLADVREEDYTLDPQELDRLISKHTKAVVAVHFNGIPCQMDKLSTWCKEHGIVLIEDAAQCLGATFNGKRVGSIGDFSIFSFAFDKHLTAGGGGLLGVNNSSFLYGLEEKRLTGVFVDPGQEDRILKSLARNLWIYLPEHYSLGRQVLRIKNKVRPERALPFEMAKPHLLGKRQEALINSELRELEGWNDRRRQRVKWYLKALEERELLSKVEVPSLGSEASGTRAVPLRYTIRLEESIRRRVADTLLKAGIETGPFIYSAPLHLKQEIAAQAQFSLEALKRSESLSKTLLNLPIHSHVTQDVVERIIMIVSQFV